MRLDPNMTLRELALEAPTAIGVLEKWKLDYCCHGNRSVATACAEAGIDAAQLLAQIQPAPPAGDANRLQNETLTALQKHIIETHHVFTREILETIRLLASKVAARHGANHPAVIRVEEIAGNLYDDLMPHMMKEEMALFPYVEAMESALARGEEPPEPFFGTVQNPIRMMMA